jgi:hypothetical protein
MSRIVDVSVMRAMMMLIAPAEVGHRTRIQSVAKKSGADARQK